MNKEICMMVIVKKRILDTLIDPVGMEFDEEKKSICVKDDDGKVIGSACLKIGQEYGMDRLKIEVDCLSQDEELYTYLVSKLCLYYDTIPSKYPLYIVLDSSQLDTIKCLARIGFTPYLGQTKDISEDTNKEIWESITNSLREQDQ